MAAKRNYVNNPDLLEALKQYLKQCDQAAAEGKQIPQVPKYIGECIYMISSRLSTKANFGGYPFREDMVMDGIENCLKYIRNFNPEKSNNPFAYFSRVIWRAFVRRIKREKKQMYIRFKASAAFQHSGETFEGDDEFTSNSSVHTTYMDDFIADYEAKNVSAAKKTKKAVV